MSERRPAAAPAVSPWREDFPALAHEPVAYLDNAATTQKPACVLDVMDSFYRTGCANPHRSPHAFGVRATALYESAREATASFVGARPDEIVFTSGATASLNLVADAYALEAVGEGDEVAVALFEHHSNLLPWQMVARRRGARLRYLVSDEEGRLSDEEIDRIVGPRTRIVALSHVSNVLGSVAPVARVVAAAHAVGAVVVLDCAQSIAHMPVDVRALDVDFAAFSGHKMYAPMGIGALFGRRELLASMRPFMRGGGMVESVFEQRAAFLAPPARFEAGTPNVGGAVGLARAAGYLADIGFDAVRDHERRLTQRLLDGLAGIDGVRVLGPPRAGEGRCGIVSFALEGVPALDIARVLARDGVAVRAGAHCAEPLVRFLGYESVCRASLALYNDATDVDALLVSLSSARRTLGRLMMLGLH